MKNKDLIEKLRRHDPEADAVIFIDPVSDEYITLSIKDVMLVENQITIYPGPVISRSGDWDHWHPRWPAGGRVIPVEWIGGPK